MWWTDFVFIHMAAESEHMLHICVGATKRLGKIYYTDRHN